MITQFHFKNQLMEFTLLLSFAIDLANPKLMPSLLFSLSLNFTHCLNANKNATQYFSATFVLKTAFSFVRWCQNDWISCVSENEFSAAHWRSLKPVAAICFYGDWPLQTLLHSLGTFLFNKAKIIWPLVQKARKLKGSREAKFHWFFKFEEITV